MKVGSLSGQQLNLLVAHADNPDVNISTLRGIIEHGGLNYAQDWIYGGPIIERERIYAGDKHGVSAEPGPEHWCCYKTVDGITIAEEWGATMLEAAMRCFVASKLGKEVSMPAE